MPDKDAMRLGSLILAGGRSERMGRPKESLPFLGETLLARTAATLQRCTDAVLVVARPGQSLPALPSGVDRIDDEQPGQGPLAALATGLRTLRARHGVDDRTPVFVTACDLPFLTTDAVHFLGARLGDAMLALPRLDGHLQPLCAIYRCGVLAAADLLLQRGERMPRALATAVPARIVDEDELRQLDPTLHCFTNVNSEDDYDRALRDGSR